MSWSLFRKQSFLGIDIQADSIRLVELGKDQGNYRIIRAAILPLAAGIVVNQKIIAWSECLEVLKAGIKSHGIKLTKRVAIALSSKLVKIQYLEVPSSFDELAIDAEIYKHNSLDPTKRHSFCIDFAKIAVTEAGYSRIAYAMTSEAYVLQCVESLYELKLAVKVIDVDILALKRAISFYLPVFKTSMDVSAILYQVAKRYLFLVYQGDDIIVHQWWDEVEPDPEWFENKLARYQSAFRTQPIQRLAILGVINPNFNSTISEVYSEADLRQLMNMPADLMIATGLALYGVTDD